MGSISKSVIPELIRCNANNLLGKIHSEPEICIPYLVKQLKENWVDTPTVGMICSAIGGFGTNAVTALPVLLELMRTGDVYERFDAAEAVLKIQRDNSQATDFLKRTLTNDPVDGYPTNVASMAMGVVYKLGTNAVWAIPIFENLRGQTNSEFRKGVEDVLNEIRGVTPPPQPRTRGFRLTPSSLRRSKIISTAEAHAFDLPFVALRLPRFSFFKQSRVLIIEILELDPRNFLADETFDGSDVR
jgi:hypothetical protein